MIASIQFRHFKALRAASLKLQAFNLVIGPNGSGKTSLIQAVLRLRNFAQQPLATEGAEAPQSAPGPELVFHFDPPNQATTARLHCLVEMVCDHLQVTGSSPAAWEALGKSLIRTRVHLFDHYAMAAPAPGSQWGELSTNGGNLGAVLAGRRMRHPAYFELLEHEALRLMPEFSRIDLRDSGDGKVDLGLILREDGDRIPADGLSQGNLYLLAMLALAFDPSPPPILCIEDVDRGIHPRKLRDVRDLLYRLSYPSSFGLERPPTQVIATTHSPYLLDQFRDHPEEVVIAQKSGRSATFARLIERPDLDELLREGSLGDMWFSGLLGGVPEEE